MHPVVTSLPTSTARASTTSILVPRRCSRLLQLARHSARTEPVKETNILPTRSARGTAFMDRHKDRPWFLYLTFNAVHTPMQANDARLARFAESRIRRDALTPR